MKVSKWPIYFADNLILGNQASSIGVATLWTPKEHFAKKLDTKSYKVVGQLYSGTGINPLIRNVLANPTIRTIILCGLDRIHSGDALLNFVKNGLTPTGKVIGHEDTRVDKEISPEALAKFRKEVAIVDMRGVLKAEEVQKKIDTLNQDASAWSQPQIFKEDKIETEEYPCEKSGFIYRGQTVAEAWPKVLHAILKFGEIKRSNYTNATQKELLNMITVISDEDPQHIDFVDYFTFTKKDFEIYKPQVMTADPMPTVSYTYGMRMRNHDHIDQIKTIIKKLKKQPWDRQAMAVLWKVSVDNESAHPPCVNLVQAEVKYHKLQLTAYIRSNDMFRAWPQNTLALRVLQKEIADGIDYPLGLLTIISSSAHIYAENYEDAQEVVCKHYPSLPCEQDKRGNYIITRGEQKIQVLHQSPQGEKLKTYAGKTAMVIFNQIISDEGVSVLIHACDLGAELQKAEIALKLGIVYTQDRPLPYQEICKKYCQ